MVLYHILLSQSWSTTVPNFMLVSGIAQSGQNLALSRLAIVSLCPGLAGPLSTYAQKSFLLGSSGICI